MRESQFTGYEDMKKIVLISVLVIIFPNISNAEVTKVDHYFKAFCVGEQSSGYNWENNNWVSKNFEPENFLIQKIKIEKRKPNEKDFPPSALCRRELMDERMKDHYGCYNIRKTGKPITRFDTHICFEDWEIDYDIEGPTKFKKLRKVYCGRVTSPDQYVFKPNGWFQHSRIVDDLRDDAKEKPSIFSTVGKCSVLE